MPVEGAAEDAAVDLGGTPGARRRRRELPQYLGRMGRGFGRRFGPIM